MLAYKAPSLPPGAGTIVLSPSNPTSAVFSTLEYSYPLKLIVPSRYFFDRLACAYMISYGGGLLGGDRLALKVTVEEGCALALLTQGSTKVFKFRPSSDAPSSSLDPSTTRQSLRCTLLPGSSLFLLPAPVTCFASASYTQKQTFDLASDWSSNLLVLDWYTSGRMEMKREGGSESGDTTEETEEWAFDKYRSENLITLGGKVLVKDVLLLSKESCTSSSNSSSYHPRVSPYSCYLTLHIFGPSLAPVRAHLLRLFAGIVQYPQSRPFDLLWSFSTLEEGKGGILRCAGDTTEKVKDWLVAVLKEGGMEAVVGVDLWKAAFM